MTATEETTVAAAAPKKKAADKPKMNITESPRKPTLRNEALFLAREKGGKGKVVLVATSQQGGQLREKAKEAILAGKYEEVAVLKDGVYLFHQRDQSDQRKLAADQRAKDIKAAEERAKLEAKRDADIAKAEEAHAKAVEAFEKSTS